MIMSSTQQDRRSVNNLDDMPFLTRLLRGGIPEGKLVGLVGPTGTGRLF